MLIKTHFMLTMLQLQCLIRQLCRYLI